jgi:hypothetical protein
MLHCEPNFLCVYLFYNSLSPQAVWRSVCFSYTQPYWRGNDKWADDETLSAITATWTPHLTNQYKALGTEVLTKTTNTDAITIADMWYFTLQDQQVCHLTLAKSSYTGCGRKCWHTLYRRNCWPKYSTQHPAFKYSQSVFFLHDRDQVSHPYASRLHFTFTSTFE